MMMHVAVAMHYIHAQGIVHCDIKSDCVCQRVGDPEVHQTGWCGVAVVLATNAAESARFSQGGRTAQYFAPEQANGEN